MTLQEIGIEEQDEQIDVGMEHFISK